MLKVSETFGVIARKFAIDFESRCRRRLRKMSETAMMFEIAALASLVLGNLAKLERQVTAGYMSERDFGG